MTDTGPADYWPMLKAYHLAREPLYRDIIRDVFPGPPGEAAILDAGSGDGFYGRLIAEVLGPKVWVVALDRQREGLAAQPLPERVAAFQGDMEVPGLQPQSFDAIWLCRSLHSAGDPPARLRALARLLRPGGRLIVVENDFAHHPILAWPADFERRVLTAHFKYMESQCSQDNTLERYHSARHVPAWLRQAGLRPAYIHTYLSEDVAPLSDEVETYWRLFLQWMEGRIFPFLLPEDQCRYRELRDPTSPDYLLSQSTGYCVELTTVGCGIAPE